MGETLVDYLTKEGASIADINEEKLNEVQNTMPKF
jgi:hypothetical protein